MGYRCPVCEDPQADDVHLANHLAFTALARGGDHEGWLDEHVPEWESMGETDLAAEVTDRAQSAEFPAVFEDTTGHSHDHGPLEGQESAGRNASAGHGIRHEHGGPDQPFGGELDEEARAAIERARELTRERRTDEDEAGGEGEDEP